MEPALEADGGHDRGTAGRGWVFITASEWSNPGTLGGLDPSDRGLAGFFTAVMPRTAGFNSIDISQMYDGTLLGTVVLMFIGGGGSASTAGGIKVTTFSVLLFVIYAEVRGEPEVNTFHRSIGHRLQRQALTVALLGSRPWWSRRWPSWR